MDINADIARIESQWPRIEAHLVDDESIARRADAVSQWGVGQQLLHLLRVLKAISGGIDQMLAANGPIPSPLQPPPGDTTAFRNEVLANGIPRGVGVSPDFLRVDAPPSLGAIRKELGDARDAWSAVSGRGEEIAVSESTFPHHHLGNMVPAEWVRFIGHHTEHHLAIIDDILAAAAESPSAEASPGA